MNLLTYLIAHPLVTNSTVHSSLHSNCHHQIIFYKFNLKIHYPPPYKRLVWEYDKANKDLIMKAFDAFDWDKTLSEKYVNDQVLLFNETLLNTVSNFNPNKLIIFDDKEPPWFDRKIKNLIKIQKSNLQRHAKKKSNHK